MREDENRSPITNPRAGADDDLMHLERTGFSCLCSCGCERLAPVCIVESCCSTRRSREGILIERPRADLDSAYRARPVGPTREEMTAVSAVPPPIILPLLLLVLALVKPIDGQVSRSCGISFSF